MNEVNKHEQSSVCIKYHSTSIHVAKIYCSLNLLMLDNALRNVNECYLIVVLPNNTGDKTCFI